MPLWNYLQGWTFTDDQKGQWELGCFQPGHYEAGMKAPFVVE